VERPGVFHNWIDRPVHYLDLAGIWRDRRRNMVLDRTTGEYQRAYVGMICVDKKCTKLHLFSDTLLGKCARPIL